MSGTLYGAAAPVLTAARVLAEGQTPGILAIDGRCGSGKTALGNWLANQLGCPLIHMDDFYLPPARRRPDWARHPGANMDFARLRQEVLAPLLAGHPAAYRAYACGMRDFLPARQVEPGPLVLLEGSYSLHPALNVLLAYRVFVSCAPDCQRARLQVREGSHYQAFAQRWIPLEEAYLAACRPETTCDFLLDTTALTV